MKNAVIIMVKVPEPGFVKTRLQPFLTKEQSAGLAVALLRDAEAKAKVATEHTLIAFTPLRLRSGLVSVLQHDHILLDQSGSDLGERMANAFKDVFDLGYEHVVMIGTDSPTLQVRTLNEAFELLNGAADAVIGKTEDGGFYLIGLGKYREGIFDGVDWRTSETFEPTVANIERMELRLEMLPLNFDIDREQDLIRLLTKLKTDPDLAIETANWANSQRISTFE